MQRYIHHPNNLASEILLKPDIVVYSGLKELDELVGGFKAGEITFIDGDSDLISIIPNQLCVNTLRAFSSDSVYIDGGMCANPYLIAHYARIMEINEKEALNHVHISRAFTVYQMTTLIQYMLEPLIDRHGAQTLIIGKFPFLYLDSDVKTNEAQTLIRINIEKIRNLTNKYNLVTVFTNLDKKMISKRRNIRKILYDTADEIIKMKQNKDYIYVNAAKKQKDIKIITYEKGQLCLQYFGMVI
jgi:hypothetical protein